MISVDDKYKEKNQGDIPRECNAANQNSSNLYQFGAYMKQYCCFAILEGSLQGKILPKIVDSITLAENMIGT